MRRRSDEGLDALLTQMLELEARLRSHDGNQQDVLGDGQVQLLREEHDLRLASDECEIILSTDAPIGGRPDDPFEPQK